MNINIVRLVAALIMMTCTYAAQAQLPKVYDESIDVMEQIDQAIDQAAQSDRYVMCQVGGNWCRWCLMFADFIAKDADLSQMMDNNYVYIHVNYPRDGAAQSLMARLGNPGRFGYPALVVLDAEGKVVHIQDSSYLESGDGYDHDKVMRFLKNWTPKATEIK